MELVHKTLAFLRANIAGLFWTVVVIAAVWKLTDGRTVGLNVELRDPRMETVEHMDSTNTHFMYVTVDACEYVIVQYRGMITAVKADCDCVPMAIQARNADDFER